MRFMCILAQHAPKGNPEVRSTPFSGYVPHAQSAITRPALSTPRTPSSISDLPRPTPGDGDLLVAVKAISVNPVDTKVRGRPEADPKAWAVLAGTSPAWSKRSAEASRASGRVTPCFTQATAARRGVGIPCRRRTDRRAKPRLVEFAEAAALPLTSITAWEALFDRLSVDKPVPGAAPAILIIGGAGGVGSIAVQLARRRTDLTVIATALAARDRGMGEGPRGALRRRPFEAARA